VLLPFPGGGPTAVRERLGAWSSSAEMVAAQSCGLACHPDQPMVQWRGSLPAGLANGQRFEPQCVVMAEQNPLTAPYNWCRHTVTARGAELRRPARAQRSGPSRQERGVAGGRLSLASEEGSVPGGLRSAPKPYHNLSPWPKSGSQGSQTGSCSLLASETSGCQMKKKYREKNGNCAQHMDPHMPNYSP
jgi:hypothetical protein